MWMCVWLVTSLICAVYCDTEPDTSTTELPVTIPLKKPHISSLHITSDIKFRYATTTVESRVKNPDTVAREAIFDVTLPNEAFITNLTLEIDGEVVVGEIKEKEAAKKQYDAAKARGESAGYIGTKHRETNRFNLAVTVAAQEKVAFHLTYQELLKRKHGYYEQVIYIDPGEPVPDMSVSVSIQEYRPITKLNVPRLRNDIFTDEGTDVSAITEISYASENQAFVRIAPSMEYQQKQSDSGMAGQFVVQYDVERLQDAGDILLVNGYFVHFFAPVGLERLPNDVLFILDTSGSMVGTKLKQLKVAMKSILGQLEEGDRINIITFATGNSYWKDTMVNIADEDIMEEALQHIDSLQAEGWTNIEGSLTEGLRFLETSSFANGDYEVRSSIIVFLTDGEATSGVIDTKKILKSVRTNNTENIPIFSLAFGEYADYEIVKKLAIQNNGFGRKIYEASDAAMQISGIYNEIAVTLMSNVTFQYLDAPVSNLTTHWYTNYFNGSEMVVAGRISSSESVEFYQGILKMKIIGNTVRGKKTIVPTEDSIMDQIAVENMTKSGEFEEITEKVWAYLTIKQLLDRIVGSMDTKEKAEIKHQALQMSLKYGFVTPLTSMVVTTTDVYEDYTDYVDPTPEPVPTFAPLFSDLSLFDDDDSDNFVGYSNSYSSDPMASGRLIASPQKAYGMPHAMTVSVSTPVQLPTTAIPKRTTKKPRKTKPKVPRYDFPSIVFYPGIASPLCFAMRDIASDSYIAYGEKDFQLVIELSTKTRKNGKQKTIIQSLELEDFSTNSAVVITSDTITSNTKYVDGQYPWEIRYPAIGSFNTVFLGGLRLKVTPSKNNGLTVEVFREKNKDISNIGIFGKLLSKNLVLVKPKKGDSKQLVYVADGLKKTRVVYKNAGPDVGYNCWSPRWNDDNLLNVADSIVPVLFRK